MARLKNQIKASGHIILVVDDDVSIVETLTVLLKQDGHKVLTASNGKDALEICQTEEIHLILLDYFMPGMTGEEVVREVRTFNSEVQILLQTGYASDKPARQMLKELDIQGYHDKSEGPEKLLILVDASLKAFRHASALLASREGLNYILKATSALHRLQPLNELLEGILTQIQGLLGFAGMFVATFDSGIDIEAADEAGLIATSEREKFEVRIATGRYQGVSWEDLSENERQAAITSVASGKVQTESILSLPLLTGDRVVGVVLMDNKLEPSVDLKLLEVFASQAAVAIENVMLYELATVDDLTRLATRRHWFQQFENTLQLAHRHKHPLSLIMLDIDRFKTLNDKHGHLAGDRVLASLGRVLKKQLRNTDFIGRYGGEEIIVALPHTDLEGALTIAEKLREVTEKLAITYGDKTLRIAASLGVTSLNICEVESAVLHESYLESLGNTLIEAADNALYEAKDQGRNRVVAGRQVNTDTYTAMLNPIVTLEGQRT
jgi:diguanylate cyclase (GGDEF)-like protein